MSNIRSALAVVASVCLLVLACAGESQSRRTANGKFSGDKVEADGDGVTASDSTGEDSTGSGTGSDGEGTAEGSDADYVFQPNYDLTYVKDTKAILDAMCVSCHGSTSPKLDNYTDVFAARDAIFESVKNGSMPQGTEMSFEVKRTLLEWILAGAPEGESNDPIQFSFSAPTLINTPVVGTNYMIGVSFDSTFNGNWSIYYSTTLGAMSGGTVLVENQPIAADGNFDWDLSALPNGLYYLYAKLTEGSRSKILAATGFLRKGLPTITMTPQWKMGNTAFQMPTNLNYSVVNVTGGGTLTVKVERKSGSAGIYTTLAAAETDLTKFAVTAAMTPEGVDYYYRISLMEDGSPVSVDESTGPVGLSPTAFTYSGLITAFIGAACDSCHGNVMAPNAVSFRSDAAGYNLDQGAAIGKKGPIMVDRVHGIGNIMPKTGTPLTQIQINQTKLWLWQGGIQ